MVRVQSLDRYQLELIKCNVLPIRAEKINLTASSLHPQEPTLHALHEILPKFLEIPAVVSFKLL